MLKNFALAALAGMAQASIDAKVANQDTLDKIHRHSETLHKKYTLAERQQLFATKQAGKFLD